METPSQGMEQPNNTDIRDQLIRTPGLSNPHAPPCNGDVYIWLITQIATSIHTITPFSPNHTTALTARLENHPSSWSLTDLRGSLSFIVLSRRRIYIAHLGATPTHAPPNHLTPEAQNVFNNLYTYTHLNGDLFNTPDNNLRVFILAPFRSRTDTTPALPYPDLQNPARVRALENTLSSILGRISILAIPFTPLDRPDPMLASPKGKVFVQYDPAAYWADGMGGENIQVAGLEVWVEDGLIQAYRDVWTVSVGGLQALPWEREGGL